MKRACIKSLVEDFLSKEVEREEIVLVAVSGGVDSMVLLHALADASANAGIRMHVAHVNHGLRGEESEGDAAFVEGAVALLGLPFTCVSVSIDGKRTGIEAAARSARYDALERVAESIGARYIAVGHNADDVAETLLMNLSRGSGPSGLSSHRKTRACGDATVIRPLHGITREEIEAFAKDRGIEWREDSSNQDPKFLRNRVRHELIPLLREVFGQDFCSAVHRSASLIEEQCNLIDSFIDPLVESVAEQNGQGVTMSIDPIHSIDPAMMNEVIRKATRGLGSHPISYDDTSRIRRLIASDPGKMETLSRGFVARRTRRHIHVTKNNATQ